MGTSDINDGFNTLTIVRHPGGNKDKETDMLDIEVNGNNSMSTNVVSADTVSIYAEGIVSARLKNWYLR